MLRVSYRIFSWEGETFNSGGSGVVPVQFGFFVCFKPLTLRLWTVLREKSYILLWHHSCFSFLGRGRGILAVGKSSQAPPPKPWCYIYLYITDNHLLWAWSSLRWASVRSAWPQWHTAQLSSWALCSYGTPFPTEYDPCRRGQRQQEFPVRKLYLFNNPAYNYQRRGAVVTSIARLHEHRQSEISYAQD